MCMKQKLSPFYECKGKEKTPTGKIRSMNRPIYSAKRKKQTRNLVIWRI